jgi:hypothetical protein
MEYWLNKLNENENDTEALFHLANNNDKNQEYYINKGLSINSDNILLKACSLEYTNLYLHDILNSLNDINENDLGYVYYELGKYYLDKNNYKCKEYLIKSIKYGYLITYMYLHP